MKLFSKILALYLLLLAIVPCCIMDNCPDDKTEQAVNHEEENEDCGSCSPFFSCEGCASATIVYEQFQFDFSISQNKPAFTAYLQQFLPQATADFWQPPKIG